MSRAFPCTRVSAPFAVDDEAYPSLDLTWVPESTVLRSGLCDQNGGGPGILPKDSVETGFHVTSLVLLGYIKNFQMNGLYFNQC
jgi:hypothetical protein